MPEPAAPVYHLEIRRFPRSLSRFNLDGTEVGAVVLPWIRDEVLELEDQKWNPREATITILLGPPIPLDRLTMGRGWRIAQRESEDVTERVLEEARRAVASGVPGTAGAGAGGAPATAPALPVADQLALGVELAGLLGSDAVRLLAAWRAVAARSSGLAPSETLALAERDLRTGGGAIA